MAVKPWVVRFNATLAQAKVDLEARVRQADVTYEELLVDAQESCAVCEMPSGELLLDDDAFGALVLEAKSARSGEIDEAKQEYAERVEEAKRLLAMGAS